jgi:hypothetical protein
VDRPIGKIGSVCRIRINHLTPGTKDISEMDFFEFLQIFGFLEVLVVVVGGVLKLILLSLHPPPPKKKKEEREEIPHL